MSDELAGAFDHMARTFWPGRDTSHAAIGAWIWLVALETPGELERRFRSILAYCEAEGLNPYTFLMARIHACPEYKKQQTTKGTNK